MDESAVLSFEEAFEEPGGFGLIFRDRLAQRDVWEELVAQPLPRERREA